MAIIYKATCKTTGKSYIGYTTMRLKDRFKYCGKRAHLVRAFDLKEKSKFYNALRKYGWQDFTVSILEKMTIEQAKIREANGKTYISNREIYWIEKYDAYYNGYNMTLGGDGIFGLKMSEETRRKISLASTGRSCSGWHHTEEAKRKISQISKGNKYNLGRTQTQEEKDKRAASLRGKHRTEEQKAKMSKIQKEVWSNEELRQKHSAICKGRVISEEQKQKISNTLTGRKLTEQTKRKIGIASKNRVRTKEWNDKISKAAKARWAKKKGINNEQNSENTTVITTD